MRWRSLLASALVAAMLPVALPVRADVPAPGALAFVTPEAAAVLDLPSTTVVLHAPAGAKLSLLVNGTPVTPDHIASTVTAADGSELQTWNAVPLDGGQNVISARIDLGDAPSAPVERIVTVRGAASRLVLTADQPSVPADGKSLITFTGHLLGADGRLATHDVEVRLTESDGTWVGESAKPELPGFIVEAAGGTFTAVLRAGVRSAASHVTATAGTFSATADVDFTTAYRAPIATGMVDLRLGARQLDFYKSIDGFLDGDLSSQPELQANVFMTGKVGNYLATAAFDTAYAINPPCNGTIGVTSYLAAAGCQNQYPIYGDSSTADRMAQSSDNVYVRIERDRTYAMWGDYDTKEFDAPTQFYSATQMNLHGFKFNDQPSKLQLTGFYADDVAAFQRDAIAPDGTSGFYYLSHQLLTPGTEIVYVESHLYNQPGVIVNVIPKTRGTDYSIDYDRGAILFTAPIARTDIDSLGRVIVNTIVATYEYDGGSGTGSMVGARLRYASFVQRDDAHTPFSIGSSYIHENMGTSSFSLFGIDAGAPLGVGAKVVGEYAYSTNAAADSAAVDGQAYRVEADLHNGKTSADAYYRTTSAGFSNDATTSFIPGQTQQGVTFDTPVARHTSAFFAYDQEREDGVAPEIVTDPVDLLLPGAAPVPGAPVNTSSLRIGGGLRQSIGRGTLTAEYDADQETDFNTPALDTNAAQFVARLREPFGQKFELLAEDDINVRQQIDNLYPDRFAVGVGYTLAPGMMLAATHQYLKDEQSGPRTFDTLEALVDDKLDADTSVTARYAILGGFDGLSGSSAFGLKHLLRIAKGLRGTVAYEYINNDVFDLTPNGMQFAQPYAVGQNGQTALGITGGTSLSTGLDYVGSQFFKANALYEHRVSTAGSNTVYRFDGAGKLSDAVSLLAGYDRANGGNQTLEGLAASSDFRAGAAWRNPSTDTTNVLVRYEYQVNPDLTPATLLQGAGTWTNATTFALEVDHEPSRRLELYGKFAFRQQTAFLAYDFSNATYTSLAQARAVYRIGRRWDVGGELRWIAQPVTGYAGLGEAFEAGYALGEDLRAAVGYAFGHAYDTTFSGSGAHGGIYVDISARVHELFPKFGLQNAPPPDLSGAGLPAAAAVRK